MMGQMGQQMGQMMNGMMQNMVGGMMQQAMEKLMQRFGGGMQMNGNYQQMTYQLLQNQEVQQKAGPFINGKSQEQLKETFRNLSKERGIDADEFAKQMGVTLPK